MVAYAVYIHIPFCRHRCAYCDFNTYAGLDNLIPDYVDALQGEIQGLTESASERFPVHSVYFGGGTPSLLPAFSIAKILHTLNASFDLASNAEISLEANPGTLSSSYLQDLHSAGINRLSLGMQSAHPRELAFLERQHRFDDVLESVKWARQAGFDNLSLDLIFGLPEQPIEIWEESLTQALNLTPEHFSLYALTLEQGTPMQNWVARGLIPEPDPDLAAEMYELACEKLAAVGYVQYEISNWALTRAEGGRMKDDLHSAPRTPHIIPVPFGDSALDWACRHNLQYWRNQPYLGFGAGAHGFAGGFRTANVLAPAAYIKRLSPTSNYHIAQLPNQLFPRTPATISVQPIDRKTEMGETMMMGLRLTREGVSRSAFQDRFDQDICNVFAPQIDSLINWELLEWTGSDNDILRLTPRGHLLGNRVFCEFV